MNLRLMDLHLQIHRSIVNLECCLLICVTLQVTFSMIFCCFCGHWCRIASWGTGCVEGIHLSSHGKAMKTLSRSTMWSCTKLLANPLETMRYGNEWGIQLGVLRQLGETKRDTQSQDFTRFISKAEMNINL